MTMTLAERRATAVFALGIATAACSRKAAVEERPSEVVAPTPSVITIADELVERGRVVTAVVERTVASGVLEVPGEVHAGESDEAIVGSLVAGRVTELKVAVGDRVAKDQVLAVVQAPEVARLRADARRGEARLAVALRGLTRLRELEAEGATSVASIEHAQADVSGARAELDAVRTQLAGLGLRVEPERPTTGDAGALLPSHVFLRSPIDGVVADRSSVLGSSVSPGDSLYRVVSGASRVVLAHVPEARAADLDLSGAVFVRAREAAVGTSEPCSATAERVTTVVDEARTVLVRVRLAEGCALKIAGRSLTVALPLTNAASRGPAILVPVAAVVELRGRHVVFVQERERSAFSWRAVRLGDPLGDRVTVEDGLGEGERVVVRGTVLLKGEIVRAEPLE